MDLLRLTTKREVPWSHWPPKIKEVPGRESEVTDGLTGGPRGRTHLYRYTKGPPSLDEDEGPLPEKVRRRIPRGHGSCTHRDASATVGEMRSAVHLQKCY